jgi:hypothetical protein
MDFPVNDLTSGGACDDVLFDLGFDVIRGGGVGGGREVDDTLRGSDRGSEGQAGDAMNGRSAIPVGNRVAQLSNVHDDARRRRGRRREEMRLGDSGRQHDRHGNTKWTHGMKTHSTSNQLNIRTHTHTHR